MSSFNYRHFLSIVSCLFSLVTAGTRTLTFKNSCNEPVRLGFTSGAIPASSCHPNHASPCPGIHCASSSDCPQNGVCNLNNNQCYYPSFLPSDRSIDLNANDVISLNINIGDDNLYSGALYVSTGCNSPNYKEACETAICPDKPGTLLPKQCDAFTGPVGPHTRAEFTFAPSGNNSKVDFYDISLMSGANVPISIGPSTSTPGHPDPTEAKSPYTCATAGSVRSDAARGLSGCSYAYNAWQGQTDFSSDVVFVAAADPTNLVPCTPENTCADASLTCGLVADRAGTTGKPTTSVYKQCGKPVGVWNADEVCIYSNGVYNELPYQCNTNTKLKGTNTDLYACSGSYPHSGYQDASKDFQTAVCGCHNWATSPPQTEQCKYFNKEWEDVVLPWAQIIKDMCPTAYSYAYDDVSSTFICRGGTNMDTKTSLPMTYDITFCPQGTTVHKAMKAHNHGEL